jgi:cytochrome c-type biogenesis protein
VEVVAVSPSNVNFVLAFGGGVVSILSPCVLPLVPGYLSLVTGLSVGELQAGHRHHVGRIVGMTALFALGFTAVFTVLGLAATGLGQAAFRNQATLTRVSGVVVLVMALYLAGSQVLRAPWLYPEARLHVRANLGFLTAPVTGAAFAFGWSPCLGPIIASVFAVAETETGVRSVLLLVAYGAGMGVSFLAVGLAFGRWAAPLDFVKRHLRAITLGSAGVLGAFGVLLILDRLSWLNAQLVTLLDRLGLDRIVELG